MLTWGNIGKKRADESRKGKYHENNPRLECEVEEQSITTKINQNTECLKELATTTTKRKKENKKNVVSCTDTRRKSNPAATEKYLTNQKSVQSKEWLCRTCNNYLVKNKVPPAALVNGMQFATKPEFFWLEWIGM